jgi:hypothetical protein
MKKVVLMLALAMGLAACQPNPPVENNVVDVVSVNNTAAVEPTDCGLTSNTLLDEKALFAAETAYNIPADAYVRAMAVPATLQARTAARPYLLKAYDYLKLARTAYTAGDGCSLKQYSDLAKQFGDQAKALLPN